MWKYLQSKSSGYLVQPGLRYAFSPFPSDALPIVEMLDNIPPTPAIGVKETSMYLNGPFFPSDNSCQKKTFWNAVTELILEKSLIV